MRGINDQSVSIPFQETVSANTEVEIKPTSTYFWWRVAFVYQWKLEHYAIQDHWLLLYQTVVQLLRLNLKQAKHLYFRHWWSIANPRSLYYLWSHHLCYTIWPHMVTYHKTLVSQPMVWYTRSHRPVTWSGGFHECTIGWLAKWSTWFPDCFGGPPWVGVVWECVRH